MTYEEIYRAARDWAESEAEPCDEGPLPIWEPSFRTAAHLVGAAHADECIRIAKDAWARMSVYR